MIRSKDFTKILVRETGRVKGLNAPLLSLHNSAIGWKRGKTAISVSFRSLISHSFQPLLWDFDL